MLVATALSAQTPTPQTVVPFTIVGRDHEALTLLVAPQTTDEQLTALIRAFRTARINGAFRMLIPPTTPKATKPRNDYNVVTVFVISDPAARGDAMLHMFINQTSTEQNQKEWGQRILAYYWYSSIAPRGHQEEGTLGYKEDRVMYTNRFRTLFED